MPCFTTVRTQTRNLAVATETPRSMVDPGEVNFAAINDTVPLSVTIAERVAAIREWGRTRARGAAEVETGRKKGVIVAASKYLSVTIVLVDLRFACKLPERHRFVNANRKLGPIRREGHAI